MKENTETSRNYKASFALLTVLFFMWGFITVMNDVLINTFRDIFELTTLQSSLVQTAFFGAFFVISLIYFIVSNLFGDPINKVGYKFGMVIGLTICGIGCALFHRAAGYESYNSFLFALFVLASGVTILQIAANPYAAIMGRSETASSRLNLAQGFNSLGTTIGPLVGALLIFKVFSDGTQSTESVGSTYLVYALAFFACAAMVALSSMPPFRNEEKLERGIGALKFRHLALGIIAIFLYVGAEVSTGSFLVNFMEDPNVAGLHKDIGNKFLAYYWGGLMIGRLMGAISLNDEMRDDTKRIIMGAISLGCFAFIYIITSIRTDGGVFHFDFLPLKEILFYLVILVLNYAGFEIGKNLASRSLMIFSLIIIALLLVAAFGSGQFAFWSCIGVGLFNSIMWSNIFTLSIKGLGRYTSQGSSLLIMAIVGGAAIPPLQGWVADEQGIQISYLIPAACYLYIAFYGWKGHEVRTIDQTVSV